jgi:transposase
MIEIQLSWRVRKALKEIVQGDPQARMVRRAQTLLWLHQGESPAEIADRLGLSRRSVYKIAERFQTRGDEPVYDRLHDRPHPGRPADKRQAVQPIVTALLKQMPSEYGHRAFAWTTPMLRTQVERRLGTTVSTRTVRRVLRALRHRYKRPRYVLARRSATWRQAKGGSNAA